MSGNVELDGEVALVTGGSRNIGLAVARAFRSAGAHLCVVGRSDRAKLDAALEKLAGEAGDGKTVGALVDVTDEEAVIDLFDRIEAELGPVSILVNGAATRPHEPFIEMTCAAWSDVIETILTGTFLTSRELFRRLPEGRRGAIINIGGLSAHRPGRHRAHVITAKAGLIGLTRALAEEGLGRIRANAVVPGVIDTERRPGQSDPHIAERHSNRPVGTVEDVARAVLALSDPKDFYVTGQTLHVSGGRFMP